MLLLEIQYPAATTLTVTERVWHQSTDRVVSTSDVVAMTTLDAFSNYNSAPTYYWDDSSR